MCSCCHAVLFFVYCFYLFLLDPLSHSQLQLSLHSVIFAKLAIAVVIIPCLFFLTRSYFCRNIACSYLTFILFNTEHKYY